ncbi:hypothetical protein B0A48_17284 [Cryoendolithus antarcticus]|uniref:Uncharacterized protein n=1 Tax=Cryoendolithus antarcticus TaxID=1507870 RepID=A0A1V8SBS1_9PEZI|nr:hypothetical protein B0A48_17284 [Cryoendolithus antarcticus]
MDKDTTQVFPFFRLPQELQDRILESAVSTKKHYSDLTTPLVRYTRPYLTPMLVSRRFASDYSNFIEHNLQFATDVEPLEDVMDHPYDNLNFPAIPYHAVPHVIIILTDVADIWHIEDTHITTRCGKDLTIRLRGFIALQQLHIVLRSPRNLKTEDISGFSQQLRLLGSTVAVTIKHVKTSVGTGRGVRERVMESW